MYMYTCTVVCDFVIHVYTCTCTWIPDTSDGTVPRASIPSIVSAEDVRSLDRFGTVSDSDDTGIKINSDDPRSKTEGKSPGSRSASPQLKSTGEDETDSVFPEQPLDQEGEMIG